QAIGKIRQGPMWPGLEGLAPSLWDDATICGGSFLRTERLDGVDTPTPAIDGERSPDWARGAARTIAGVLPDARYHTLPDQNHTPAGDEFFPFLHEFFAN